MVAIMAETEGSVEIVEGAVCDSIDWKRKLTSRKLWAAVASLVVMVAVFLGSSEEAANQVAAIIMGGATVIAYIVGEGLVDYADAKSNATMTQIVAYPEKQSKAE